MSQIRHPRGFTIIDLMAVGGALVILIVVVLVAFPQRGGTSSVEHQLASSGRLRGIHQSMLIWSQSNKLGRKDGFYPGLDSSGKLIPDGPLTGYSGDGSMPGAALWMLLDGNYITPEYFLNPADRQAVEVMIPPGGVIPPLTPENFSYALQSVVGNPGGRTEWRETMNPAAIVMADRAIGTGPSNISSVFTTSDSGEWHGGVVYNDNSSGFKITPAFGNTKYGTNVVNVWDKLFEDDPTAVDAFLVHDDGITAYSAK